MIFFNCEKIRQLREYEKLTESEFAIKIGVTTATLSRWERGERIPKVIYISTMSNVFKVPVDYFFTRC